MQAHRLLLYHPTLKTLTHRSPVSSGLLKLAPRSPRFSSCPQGFDPWHAMGLAFKLLQRGYHDRFLECAIQSPANNAESPYDLAYLSCALPRLRHTGTPLSVELHPLCGGRSDGRPRWRPRPHLEAAHRPRT